MQIRRPIVSGVAIALGAAVLFGLTIPAIARFGSGVGTFTTAALLYGGAALTALILRPFVARSGRKLTLQATPRLLAVALFGAVLAPSLLVWGVGRAGPTASSLALNFEAVATILLARLVFQEAIGRRVWVAMAAMVVGGCLVAADLATREAPQLLGLLAVLGATLGWAADNTLTRALADDDPLEVVTAKGGLGATASAVLALVFGEPMPDVGAVALLALCGATGYGLSLRLYLLAQRSMGAGRTASVFAVGPFVGAMVSWVLGDRLAGAGTALGALAFGLGVWLHVTERHGHRHVHEPIEHEHAHRHDDGHHDHVHDPPFLGEHTHRHRHERLQHEHEHAPDLHHDHTH